MQKIFPWGNGLDGYLSSLEGDRGIFLVISLCEFKKFEFSKREGWDWGILTLPPLDPGILIDVIPYLQKEPFV